MWPLLLTKSHKMRIYPSCARSLMMEEDLVRTGIIWMVSLLYVSVRSLLVNVDRQLDTKSLISSTPLLPPFIIVINWI